MKITLPVARIYALICISMTLPLEYRIVLFAAIFLLGLMFYLMIPFFISRLKCLSRRFIAFSLIIILAFLEGIYAACSKGSPPFTFYLLGLFSVLSAAGIYLVMSYGDRELFFRGFQVPLLYFALIGCASFFLLNYQLLDNTNHLVALFIPSLCYYCFIKPKLIEAFLLTMVIVSLALYFEARLCLILGLLAPMIRLLAKKYIFQKLFCYLSIVLTIMVIYMAMNYNPVFNSFFSNRVLIWKYYFVYAVENLFIGYGYISSDMAVSVAKFLEDEVQRGVNLQYGTQSMIIRYLYENGIIVTLITYAYLFKQFFRKTKYANLALLGYLSTLIESVKLGVPSIFGCIFLVFLLMSATEDESELESPKDLN